MGITSSISEPEELVEFKELNPESLLDDIQIPERLENRRSTDRSWLIVFGILWVILIPFFIYTAVYSDINRIIGYDQCGNVCGKNNYKYGNIPCSGVNFTNQKYLQYETNIEDATAINSLYTPRHCVSNCNEDYNPVFDICVRHPKTNEEIWYIQLASFINGASLQIAMCYFLSLGVVVALMLCFRYATAVFVWGVLVGSTTIFIAATGYLWYLYSSDKEGNGGLLPHCIVCTVISGGFICILIFAAKKIGLIIALYREAWKAILAMPRLWLIPILALSLQVLLIILFVYVICYLSTSGILKKASPDYYVYYKNGVMIFTITLYSILAFWLMQFIRAIQYMVISGSVSKWYFAKNKVYLDSPVFSSMAIVFRYHLGTAAFSSLIVILVNIARSIIQAFARNARMQLFISACLKPIENLIKYLSKNALIVTAMHGRPFFTSGKRAARLLFHNIGSTIAINSVGQFVLAMANLMILGITLLLSVGILSEETTDVVFIRWSVAIVVVFMIVTLGILYSLFETTIDTIFICFCEDKLLNDGMVRPYAMSRELMEFIDDSKKVYWKS